MAPVEAQRGLAQTDGRFTQFTCIADYCNLFLSNKTKDEAMFFSVQCLVTRIFSGSNSPKWHLPHRYVTPHFSPLGCGLGAAAANRVIASNGPWRILLLFHPCICHIYPHLSYVLKLTKLHCTLDSSVLVSEHVPQIFLQGLYDINILCLE